MVNLLTWRKTCFFFQKLSHENVVLNAIFMWKLQNNPLLRTEYKFEICLNYQSIWGSHTVRDIHILHIF